MSKKNQKDIEDHELLDRYIEMNRKILENQGIAIRKNLMGIHVPFGNTIRSIDRLKIVNMENYKNTIHLNQNIIKSDISHRIGIPINILIDKSETGRNNQIGTFFTVNLLTGLGQNFTNSLVFFRSDGVDLDETTVLDICDYIRHVLDLFADGEIPNEVYTKEYYEKFMSNPQQETDSDN